MTHHLLTLPETMMNSNWGELSQNPLAVWRTLSLVLGLLTEDCASYERVMICNSDMKDHYQCILKRSDGRNSAVHDSLDAL